MSIRDCVGLKRIQRWGNAPAIIYHIVEVSPANARNNENEIRVISPSCHLAALYILSTLPPPFPPPSTSPFTPFPHLPLPPHSPPPSHRTPLPTPDPGINLVLNAQSPSPHPLCISPSPLLRRIPKRPRSPPRIP